jgi:hypothetical protein
MTVVQTSEVEATVLPLSAKYGIFYWKKWVTSVTQNKNKEAMRNGCLAMVIKC